MNYPPLPTTQNAFSALIRRRGRPTPRFEVLQPLPLFRHVCSLQMLPEVVHPVELLLPVAFPIVVYVFKVCDELACSTLLFIRRIQILRKPTPTESADIIRSVLVDFLMEGNEGILHRLASPVVGLDVHCLRVPVSLSGRLEPPFAARAWIWFFGFVFPSQS